MSKLDHQERLAQVNPRLVEFVHVVPVRLGGWWRVAAGARTTAEQAALFAKGRTTTSDSKCHCRGVPPGATCLLHPLGLEVTQARDASETAHGLRRGGAPGVDLVAMLESGECDWGDERYLELGRLAKSEDYGFEWGGDFKKRDPKTHAMKPWPDLGHIQIPGWRGLPLL